MANQEERLDNTFEEIGTDLNSVLARIDALEQGLILSNITTTQVTLVANVAKELPPVPVTDRKTIVIYNKSSADAFLGDSSVSVTTGSILKAGEKNSFDLDSGLFAVSASAITLSINEFS